MSTPDPTDVKNERLLALPAPGEKPERSPEPCSGLKMDHLGPIIVNPDGTMSRISNWQHLSDGERATALRLIAKRNQERVNALQALEE